MAAEAPASEGESPCSAEGESPRPASKSQQKKEEKKSRRKAAAAAKAAATGRLGPSGQRLKGPEQQTTAVEVCPAAGDSGNVLRTPAIEAENVHAVYNSIADHWSHTRYKAWPRVEAFCKSLPAGALVADLGCGNGKNLPAVQQAGAVPIASDISPPLAKIAAADFGAQSLVADCLNSPFRSESFDAAISIAVLHHLSTVPRRVQALREGARLLRPGGRFLIYCWSYEQDEEISRSRHRFVAQDVLVPWSFRTPGVKKKAPAAGTDEEGSPPRTSAAPPAGDGASTPAAAAETAAAAGAWEERPPVLQRYCHVYREGELLELLAAVPELEVLEAYFDTGNWCAIARKREGGE